MKKTWILLTAVILCAVLLFGCSPAANTPPDDTGKPETTPAAGIGETPGVDDVVEEPVTDDEDPAPPEDAYVEGPVLVFGISEEYVEFYDNVINEDGTYREELYYDAAVYISSERLAPSEFGAEAATIASLAGVAEEDITIFPYELPELGSYPAFRAEYIVGENEDTRYCVDVLIHTDNWDFLFHTAVPVDLMEDYSDLVGSWIETLAIFDA